MLYVSTRNINDTYTAYRALHEAFAADGGSYVPFHLPVYSNADLLRMRQSTCSDTIAEVLNLFFGLRLSGWDVECAIGRAPFKVESLGQRLVVAETWRNPDGSLKYLIDNLYRLACGENNKGKQPAGWALIAIQIAMLFGVYASMDIPCAERFDIAVPAGDFSDMVTVSYARAMGLPIELALCACNENSSVWDFICRGELSTNTNQPVYMETFVYQSLGADEVKRYLDARERKHIYYINEAQQLAVTVNTFATVVSTRRIDSVISGMFQSNNYRLDNNAALSYSALQDYRAINGINKNTLILAKKRTN